MCDDAYELVGDDRPAKSTKNIQDAQRHLSDAMSGHDPETPVYVHRLVDALLRHEPLDWQGAEVPDDVKERIALYFADRKDMTTRLEIADSEALGNLNALLAAAIHAEMSGMAASDDFAWQRLSLGVLGKMGGSLLGWCARDTDRAYAFVLADHYETAPEDGREYVPVFRFGK